jgi:copper resistance protein B
MNKKFLILFLIFLTPKNLLAAHNHGDDNSQIFHNFTVDAETGNSAKAFALDGWIGGDFNRLWLKAEKSNYKNYDATSEVQALYSRNVADFWDAQIGLRRDFSNVRSKENINFLTLGLRGLAPYFVDTDFNIFLSDEGDLSLRLQQQINLLITQKITVQPYFKTEFFANDVGNLTTKRGFSELELGITTLYKITPKLSPYISVLYNTKTFGTKNATQKNGGETSNFAGTVGIEIKF